MDTSEAHAERAVLREQLDRAYDTLQLKRTEERNMVQDVAQVCHHTLHIAAVVQQTTCKVSVICMWVGRVSQQFETACVSKYTCQTSKHQQTAMCAFMHTF